MRAAGLIATLAAAVAACLTTSAPAARSPVCKTTVERDPRRLLQLEASPLEPAMAAAVRFERAKDKPIALGASLAVVDPRKGPAVKRECGARVWQRTVVVYARLTALSPKQKHSQPILFVGRFPGGYRVWQVVY